MDFLASQEGGVFLDSPTSTRNHLTRVEVERERSKADKVTWFTHNEFLWRSGASFIWFIFLLPGISVLYMTLVLVSIKHPIAWITDVFSKIFSFWDLFIFISTFGIIVTPIFLLNINICSVEVKTGYNRLSFVQSFFTIKQLSHLTFCILTGSIAIHWLTSFTYIEYGIFTHNCSTLYNGRQFLCFNEMTLFLHVFGGFLGIVYSFLYFKEKHHHIKFPVVQQERIFRVKACLLPSFWRAVVISLRSIQIVYPVYFFFGSFAKEVVRWLTGLNHDRQLSRLDSLHGLLDLSLFWFCFTSGIVIAYIWLLTNKLFIIFCIKVFRFPIQSTFTEDTDQSLPVVMKCQNVSLLKYLAFNDLCQLSQFSSKRRKQIFSLSIPGGRPLNWLWISDECLTLLNDLKERLTVHNNNHGMSRVIRTTDTLAKTPTRSFRDINQSSVKRTANSVRSHTTSEMSTSGSKTLRHTLTGHHSSGRRSSENIDNQQDHKVSMSEKLKQIPLVEYLVEKVDELEMEDLFFDVQLQIWAAEGLSRLVAASFTEDVFGVVQKTLPFILTSLLELLQAVELYLKRPLDQELLYRKRHPSEIRKTVNVLRDSLRCSVYRITETFQQHLSDIELSSGNKEFLASFLKFQE